jgi:hypothetical protein
MELMYLNGFPHLPPGAKVSPIYRQAHVFLTSQRKARCSKFQLPLELPKLRLPTVLHPT